MQILGNLVLVFLANASYVAKVAFLGELYALEVEVSLIHVCRQAAAACHRPCAPVHLVSLCSLAACLRHRAICCFGDLLGADYLSRGAQPLHSDALRRIAHAESVSHPPGHACGKCELSASPGTVCA
jgi:hypothetical protein